MDNVSSVIDGSLAVAGIVAALAVSGWALIVSGSDAARDTNTADDDARPSLKNVA
jgi:hypothetical protein